MFSYIGITIFTKIVILIIFKSHYYFLTLKLFNNIELDIFIILMVCADVDVDMYGFAIFTNFNLFRGNKRVHENSFVSHDKIPISARPPKTPACTAF